MEQKDILRPPPPFVCFSATHNCSDWCSSLVFFLSINFALQGLSTNTFWGPWTYSQNVAGLSGGPGAGPFRPATLGSADTVRARARVRSRQRCARTQARKGIGRPREPSGLAITTTITIARDQQQKVKAPKGEKSRIDTNCQSTPNPRAHSAEGVICCACGKRKPYAHNSFGGGRGGRTN